MKKGYPNLPQFALLLGTYPNTPIYPLCNRVNGVGYLGRVKTVITPIGVFGGFSVIAPTFPTVEQLQPSLDKLTDQPGSVVLIAIEVIEEQNYPRVTFSWIAPDEREALRAALTRVRLKRSKAAAALANQTQGQDSGTHDEG